MRPVLWILFAALAAAQDNSALLGRWRSLKTSKGGIGAMYEFRPNGALDFSPGAVVDTTYRLEGNQLILPPETSTGPETKATVEWSADGKLRIDYGGRGHEEYRRQGTIPDTSQPILGEWVGTRDMDGQQMPVHLFFFPGGKGLLLIQFTTMRGTYSVSAGRLRAAFANQASLLGTFAVKDGVLSITRTDGHVNQFVHY